MKIYKQMMLSASMAMLAACNSSGSLATGDDEVATQCLSFGTALQSGDSYVHKITNTCSQTVHVLVEQTDERFTLSPSQLHVLSLTTATPSLGACFDPYEPDLKSSNGKFQCRRL